MNTSKQQPVAATRRWLRDAVVGLNLCPFAGSVMNNEQLRVVQTQARSSLALLRRLGAELHLLQSDSRIETTLLVHPQLLTEFADYNEFLAQADALLMALGLDGVFQIASFHPQYRFAGTSKHAAENYSNRSPYPMLHILREASLSAAIDSHPDPAAIPAANISRMNQLGAAHMAALQAACLASRNKS